MIFLGMAKYDTHNMSFRVDSKVFEMLKTRSEVTGETLSSYVGAIIDKFAGLSANEVLSIKERRDELRDEVKSLFEEVGALEIVKDRLAVERGELITNTSRG